jgi:signal transduction histidine kinase
MWRTLHVTIISVLWILLWILVTLIEIAPSIHDPRVPLWQPIATVLVPAALVTAWLSWEIRSPVFERRALNPPPLWFGYHLRRLPLFVLVVVGLTLAIRHVIARAAGSSYPFLPWHVLLPWEVFKTGLLYCLWLGLIFGALTLAKVREDAERMLGIQKALVEAQLAQLQAQLRPHFIFNALNTVSALMHTDVARADHVLAQLGDLLRASLRGNRREAVSLQEELELLERYVAIMRERFEGRVNIQWDVAPETLAAGVPAMLLQPLLENAFKHGIERSIAPERITIRTARKGDELRIDIHNTGPGMMNGTDGVGLRNCRERLALLYGEQASLVVSDGEESGVLASVTLPWQPLAQ